MLAIARALEARGFGTFLPQRDGLEPWVLPFVDAPWNPNVAALRAPIDRAIFCLDVFQIVERCDALVLNLNGRVPDEGAVAEAAMAFATGAPVVIYKHDARSAFAGSDNSMITGLARERVDDVSALPAAVERALPRARVALSPAMTRAVDRGRALWRLLERVPKGSRSSELVEEIAALCREA